MSPIILDAEDDTSSEADDKNEISRLIHYLQSLNTCTTVFVFFTNFNVRAYID